MRQIASWLVVQISGGYEMRPAVTGFAPAVYFLKEYDQIPPYYRNTSLPIKIYSIQYMNTPLPQF
ncbi:MAG: hypothetical protein ABI575_08220 [Oxalobacteraceae bacterium]